MYRSWIISLTCLAIFCSALVLTTQSNRIVENTQEYVQRLELRKAELKRWNSSHQKLQEELRQWNRLWKKAESAGLMPDQWQDYPVRVEDALVPFQTENVMRLLSNDIKTGQEFWFAPERVMAAPVVIEDEEAERQEDIVMDTYIQGKIMTRISDPQAEGN